MKASFCGGDSHGDGGFPGRFRSPTNGMRALAAMLLAFTPALTFAAEELEEVILSDMDEPAGISAFDAGEAPMDLQRAPSTAGLIQNIWGWNSKRHACGPLWTGSVDALMLWRGNIPSLPIFFDEAENVAINARDAAPGMSAGPRFGLMRQIGCNHAIEGNYFGVEPFSGRANLPPDGGPYTIVDLGGLPSFGDIAAGTVATRGQIQSAELNWRTWNGGVINWLAGFRWVEWNESINIDYTFENPDPFGTGSLSAKTGNNLYGGQLGADLRLWNRGGRFRLNALGKAGLFLNSAAYQRSAASFTDEMGDVIPVGSTSSSTNATAFFGEVGLNATVNVTSWLAWRLGYNVFWLSGVATAPQQFQVNNIPGGTARIDAAGSVLLHGVNTGIEARW